MSTRPGGASGAAASEETAASRLASERLARTRALHAIELQRFEDPVARKVMRDEVRMQIRRMKPDLGKEIGLTTAEEEAALLELLAEQELRLTEFGYRHGRASEEERRAWNQQVEQANEEHEQQLADFLGPERLERYRKYGDTGAERQQVKELRSRLDETNTLSDAQAARLVATMYEERRRYVEEMEQYMHGKDYAYDAGYPFRAMAVTERPAARLQFAEEEAGRIEAFMKRLHDRAAIVLSAEQLRRFDELQEEHMTAVRASVEGWRAENAAAGQRQR